MESFLAEVAPWTSDQARRWRAAVPPWWLDRRWAALGWLTALFLYARLDRHGAACGTDAGQQPCPSQWISAAIFVIVAGQVGLVFAAPALGAVTRRVVIGLMAAPAPFAFYVEQVWLRRLFYACSAWTALTAVFAQWARRRQLAVLPSSSDGPPLPPLRFVRPAQVFRTARLAGALVAMALGPVLLGVAGALQHIDDVHWQHATAEYGHVEAVSDDRTHVRVRLSLDQTTRWVLGDFSKDDPVGSDVLVWVDGPTWASFYHDPYAQVSWIGSGYLCLLAGGTTAAYVLRWRRDLRVLWAEQTRILGVRLGYTHDQLLIYPADDLEAPPALVIPRGRTFEETGGGQVTWHPTSGALYGDPSNGAVVAVRAEGQVILPSGRARAKRRSQ
jgi:hypothetical protein